MSCSCPCCITEGHKTDVEGGIGFQPVDIMSARSQAGSHLGKSRLVFVLEIADRSKKAFTTLHTIARLNFQALVNCLDELWM